MVAALQARSRPVRIATRRPAPGDIRFDLLDAETWAPALDGVAHIFLMWPPGTAPKTHIFPFIDAAVHAGVQRIAFLSVLGADRAGFLPHRHIEKHLAAAPVSSVFLRAGYFMQNLSTTHRADIAERDEIFLPTGAGTMAMVDAGDVSEAAVVGLLDRSGSLAWDLTGPEALDMAQAAAILTEQLGRPIQHTNPGAVAFYRAHIRQGTPRGLAAFMVAEYTHTRLGLAGRVGDGIQEALGRPPTDFATFVQSMRAVWAPSAEG